ncbi:hypothetical protein D0N36_02655 [Hymenobacter lapidiphilus]|uniref:hypothetical protein n=1 Tax=Hymenobacter sp. CCM 8763 TaxID=2303334 RepID=UPI000E3466A4|nr:hypothetical protein [Hymenobacter sp. CCM 8763]RFP66624.1 hypothetical protein D0N36_02655 [Hymenobacter sp. CCM 8763]
MTRASLLRILDHVNGISDDEIRELEQLAAAFPYCQTAHVLLAKTAHDRGSMLAGQRLRRAATYAADRELLRQLLERPAPAALPVDTHITSAPQTHAVAAAEVAPVAPVALAAAPLPEPATAPEIDLFAVEVVSVPAPADETAVADEPAGHDSLVPAEAPANTQDTTAAATTATANEPAAAHETAVEPAAAAPITSSEAVLAELPEVKTPADEGQPASVAEPTDPAKPLATSSTTSEEAADASDDATEETAVAEKAVAPIFTNAADPADELLPAVAPPIRPPSGAGISRFEFGLGEARLPEPTSYRLPGIDNDDDTFAAEDDELPTTRSATPPRVTAPFRADAELGYALGGGSRLGYDLQGRTPDGFALDLPLEAFFEPDALLLAHARAHQPAAKTSSLDLINRFLKAQPRIKAGTIGLPLPTAEQTDLSVRSSVPAPALASESLAKIMVRQGKTAKAIEIYERLMAKQPGKMAYFAEQIQQLQQPPE